MFWGKTKFLACWSYGYELAARSFGWSLAVFVRYVYVSHHYIVSFHVSEMYTGVTRFTGNYMVYEIYLYLYILQNFLYMSCYM